MIHNTERLAVIGGLDLENPDLRHRLDEITERSAATLGQPISLVSIVLDSAQVFVGAYGLQGWLADVGGTPIEWSFCATAVRSGEPYVVPDAATDAVQASNPLVTADGIRSYAGAPIVVDGQVVGTHCVLGYEPHTYTEDELAALRARAADIAALLRDYPWPG